jgi:hypothetical protein
MSLIDAIDDVKARLIEGAGVDEAVASSAADHGLREVFLRNRALAALGDLATVAARDEAARAADAANLREASRKVALGRLHAVIADHNSGKARMSDDRLEQVVMAANDLGARYALAPRRRPLPRFRIDADVTDAAIRALERLLGLA